MPRMICHRGFWWPNSRQQNHPSSLNAALERGWDVEIDVWRTHGKTLKVGHDHPQFEWSLPSPDLGPGHLFLHLKAASADGYPWSERILEVLEQTGWKQRASIFISPEIARSEVQVVTSPVQIANLQSDKSGVWAEQPDTDWVRAETIEAIHAQNMPIYVVSSELHGRQIHLDTILQWRQADGIVTDIPHLIDQIYDKSNQILHPQESWW